MFSVFNANLLTDMGKAIAMKHLNAADAQAVWQEVNDHMSISSKGTNAVLDDSFKGSTETNFKFQKNFQNTKQNFQPNFKLKSR